jgi:hypothetical protein
MARPIVGNPKAKTDLTSYLIEEVWDGRLWYNCSNVIDDYSRHIFPLALMGVFTPGSAQVRMLDPPLSPPLTCLGRGVKKIEIFSDQFSGDSKHGEQSQPTPKF